MALRIDRRSAPAFTVEDAARAFRGASGPVEVSDDIKALRLALHERQRPGGCKPAPMSQIMLKGNRSRSVSRVGYTPYRTAARRP